MKHARFWLSCFILASATAEARAVVTIRCEPADPTPTGNDVVRFDCTLETDANLSLQTYTFAMPCTGAPDPGASQSVDHFRIPPTTCTFAGPDPVCQFDGFQGTCIGTQICFFPSDCGGSNCLPDPNNPGVNYCENLGDCQDPSPFILTSHPTYVFRGQIGVVASTTPGNCPTTRPAVGATMPAGHGVNLTPASGPQYLASFLYRVSDCAAGSFTFVLQGNGNPPSVSDQSYVLAANGQPVLISPIPSALSIASGLCCDGLNCLGDYNSYCCTSVVDGTHSDVSKTCLGGSPDACPCILVDDCDDESVCTDDSCQLGHPLADPHGCVRAPNYPPGNCCNPLDGQLDPLSDGNPCTLDYCQDGTYPAVHDVEAGNGFVCQDDGNTCTFDYCHGGACTHPDKPYGTGCSPDGVYCTWDVCDAGVCTHPDINTLPCSTTADCPAPPLTDDCFNNFCLCTTPTLPCYGDIVPPPFGDGFCQIDDLLCCLAAYSTFFDCPQADIHPCGGDGLVEIGDVLDILAGYAGETNCGQESCQQ